MILSICAELGHAYPKHLRIKSFRWAHMETVSDLRQFVPMAKQESPH